ncbi:pentapeptide repeat-containing protein [Phaeobacter italicus]|uniref:pentapeptide repeat-containing protein n=1 Tax=Phaeobacter italicus TaxID=481446 RepID=UPI000669DD67|nr:pentapeptide repeat-containing protein [Phaeobacter italicus]CRL13401.1 secreted effector protein PipB [Phaeobacter italicus]SFH50714.1 Pentapeptide repeat-containing protein [Phaeobacter italicus]
MINISDPGHLPVLALFGLAVFVVFPLIVLSSNEAKPIAYLQSKLGLDAIWAPVLLIGAALWAIVFGLLVVGLLSVIWEIIQGVHWKSTASDMSNSGRFALVRLTAITATTGAVIAFPLTLIKVKLTRDASETTEKSLFNDEINAATEDLHAMRQRWDGTQNIWEDDITRRNAAIDRLEGLVSERPDTAARVSRLLSVYVRELSREHPPEVAPDNKPHEELKAWGLALTVQRSDMENAVQTLGRMKSIQGVEPDEVHIDLRKANLQRMRLAKLDFSGADFIGAQLQYAMLSRSDLSRAIFVGTDLSWSRLTEARFTNAVIFEVSWADAKLQAAQGLSASVLREAYEQGAHLDEDQYQMAVANQ